MRIELDTNRIGQYVAEKAGTTFDVIRDHCAGLVDDSGERDRIRGGVIWTGITDTSCMLHAAGEDENWVVRDMLWLTFHYPFVQLGVVEIYAIVEEANTAALRFNTKLGFKEIFRRPRMFASGAGLILCMERDECRWVRLKPKTLKAGGLFDGG